MPALRKEEMAQGGQRRIDGVQQPEIRDLTRGEFGPRSLRGAFLKRERGGLLFQNFDEPFENLHQAAAGGYLQARRDKRRVEDEMTRAIAHDAGNRQREGVGWEFRLQQQRDVLAAHRHRLFIAAGGFVVQVLHLAPVAGSVAPGAGVEDTVDSLGTARGDREKNRYGVPRWRKQL